MYAKGVLTRYVKVRLKYVKRVKGAPNLATGISKLCSWYAKSDDTFHINLLVEATTLVMVWIVTLAAFISNCWRALCPCFIS
jgi:hypothetical protein